MELMLFSGMYLLPFAGCVLGQNSTILTSDFVSFSIFSLATGMLVANMAMAIGGYGLIQSTHPA
jgi:hypothetical protein